MQYVESLVGPDLPLELELLTTDLRHLELHLAAGRGNRSLIY